MIHCGGDSGMLDHAGHGRRRVAKNCLSEEDREKQRDELHPMDHMSQRARKRERGITSDGANIWLMRDALALGSGPGNESNQAKEDTGENDADAASSGAGRAQHGAEA